MDAGKPLAAIYDMFVLYGNNYDGEQCNSSFSVKKHTGTAQHVLIIELMI